MESLRTNTSLVRRRLRAPELKIAEVIAGRQTVTPVDILYIEGITNPDLVAETKRRLAAVDTDELLQTASLEELIVDEVDTAFPMLAYTERPDRFCAGLVEGRVGVIVDGIPPGLPAAGHRGPVLQKPARTGPRTGWRPPSCRCCGICACCCPSSSPPGMWRR